MSRFGDAGCVVRGTQFSMSVPAPHFVLFSASCEAAEPGRWRFVLQSTDGSERLVADDVEPGAWGERLELLAVVRGLEALPQPSRVTVLTPSAYVREGIRYGITEWRESGWRWEAFGQMIPVKNGDLWQRVERTLRFHQVECRHWRVDPPHKPHRPSAESPPERGGCAAPAASGVGLRGSLERIVDRCQQWLVRWLAWRGCGWLASTRQQAVSENSMREDFTNPKRERGPALLAPRVGLSFPTNPSTAALGEVS
jgi:ribonuclease HI